jgi:hypothetical protein
MANGGEIDKALRKAQKAACQIKRVKQVGSFAWQVTSKKKKYRVQTDAEWRDTDLYFTFATCECDGPYDERTTVCAHVLRVLMEISEAIDDDTDTEEG